MKMVALIDQQSGKKAKIFSQYKTIMDSQLRTHYRCAYSSSPSYENGPVARWGERLFLAFESRVNILDTRTGRRIGAIETVNLYFYIDVKIISDKI